VKKHHSKKKKHHKKSKKDHHPAKSNLIMIDQAIESI